jgi:hypothetical protein
MVGTIIVEVCFYKEVAERQPRSAASVTVSLAYASLAPVAGLLQVSV